MGARNSESRVVTSQRLSYMGDPTDFLLRNPSSHDYLNMKKRTTTLKTIPRSKDEQPLTPSLAEAIAQAVAQRCEDLDPLDVEELKTWTAKQVQKLLKNLTVKIWYKRQKGKPVEVNRLQYVAACKVLGVAESAVGQPVDVDGARVAKKALVRFLHPDTNGGSKTDTDNYQQVLVAFDIIESYAKLIAKKPRRPYRKRINAASEA